LVLERFCGREVYPVLEATWNLYEDTETGAANLCASLTSGPAVATLEDTEELRAEPTWELNVVDSNLSLHSLVAGASFTIPHGYDESCGGYVTNFYYCEHEVSDNNRIEIIAVDGDNVRLRIQAETMHVNWYDGSKPATKLSVEAWFERDSTLMRSIQ
jgi:hypothetical protein